MTWGVCPQGHISEDDVQSTVARAATAAVVRALELAAQAVAQQVHEGRVCDHCAGNSLGIAAMAFNLSPHVATNALVEKLAELRLRPAS